MVSHKRPHKLMKSPSEAPPRGANSWKGLLIRASFLSCWIQSISAQHDSITVVPNPSYGTVNSIIILNIRGHSGLPYSYSWYRQSSDYNNLIASYAVHSRIQIPADIRQKVLPNGSLLILDLTLNDTGDYFVIIEDYGRAKTMSRQGHLVVYGKSNGSSDCIGYISGTVIGVLVGMTLAGVLIYTLFLRKTGRGRKYHLPEMKHASPKHGEDTTTQYDNFSFLKGSALPKQVLGYSSTPEVPYESSYETLDITKVDIYDKIIPWKKPQA